MTCLGAAAADWRLVRADQERDIHVYVQGDPAQPYHRFYAQAHLQAPLSAVLAVLTDVPSAPEWVVRVEQARLLRRQGNESWEYTAYHLPYPFLSRDAVLHTVITRDSSGAITLDSHAVPGLVDPRPRYVRLEDAHSTWKLSPQPGGWLLIELWGDGAPGGYIPSWLYNYRRPGADPAQPAPHGATGALPEPCPCHVTAGHGGKIGTLKATQDHPKPQCGSKTALIVSALQAMNSKCAK